MNKALIILIAIVFVVSITTITAGTEITDFVMNLINKNHQLNYEAEYWKLSFENKECHVCSCDYQCSPTTCPDIPESNCPEIPEQIMGDANHDGVVNILDKIAVRNIVG